MCVARHGNIDYCCPKCGDNGTISGWRETAIGCHAHEQAFIENLPKAKLDQLEAMIERSAREFIERGIDGFDGLSPAQMKMLLDFSRRKSSPVRFPVAPVSAVRAPVVALFLGIAEIIKRQPCKATATGKLPRALCREAALSVLGQEKYDEKISIGNINREEDYFDLHTTRIVAEHAGLLLTDGKFFILSPTCRYLLERNDVADIYCRLLDAYATAFDWGYRDRYEDFTMIQRSFLFSLLLLQRYGGQTRQVSFYENAFLHAFPNLSNEARPVSYKTQEETVKGAYNLRTIRRFFEFFGLAVLNPASDVFSKLCDVTASPLAFEVVRFPDSMF